MPSPKLSVRVPDEIYSILQETAEVEKKSMTDLVRELIEDSLNRRNAPSRDPQQMLDDLGTRLYHMETRLGTALVATLRRDIMNRLELLEARQGELLIKSVRAAAESFFFARFAASNGFDLATSLAQGMVMDSETKTNYIAQLEAEAAKLSASYVMTPEPPLVGWSVEPKKEELPDDEAYQNLATTPKAELAKNPNRATLTQDVGDKLQAIAKKMDMTMGDVVQLAINEYIKHVDAIKKEFEQSQAGEQQKQDAKDEGEGGE